MTPTPVELALGHLRVAEPCVCCEVPSHYLTDGEPLCTHCLWFCAADVSPAPPAALPE